MTAHFVDLLDELRRRSLRMANLVEDMVEEACEAVLVGNEQLARRVVARDNDVDSEEVRVEQDVIKLLALYQPVGADLRLLCTLLKTNNDLERIADCAVNIAERAIHLDPERVQRASPDFKRLAPLVRQILRHAIQAYTTGDAQAARRVLEEDEAIDAMYGQTIRTVIAETPDSPGDMAADLDILSVAKNLERIADHATNIAEDVIFLVTGQIVRHRKG